VLALFEAIGPVIQRWTLDDVITAGDKVVVRATNHCTQERFLGIPAAGRQQVFSATFIHRIEDGQIAETWRHADDLGRVLQLGATIQPPAMVDPPRDEYHESSTRALSA
jgi:predicted ester cyclase